MTLDIYTPGISILWLTLKRAYKRARMKSFHVNRAMHRKKRTEITIRQMSVEKKEKVSLRAHLQQIPIMSEGKTICEDYANKKMESCLSHKKKLIRLRRRSFLSPKVQRRVISNVNNDDAEKEEEKLLFNLRYLPTAFSIIFPCFSYKKLLCVAAWYGEEKIKWNETNAKILNLVYITGNNFQKGMGCESFGDDVLSDWLTMSPSLNLKFYQ